MDDMKFPSKLFCGMDSLEKIYDGDYKSVLIISNGGAPMKTGSLLKIKRKFEMDETKAEIIISDSAPELFALTREYTEKNTPDIIIALGGGKTLDCAAAVSNISNIPYAALPEVAPTELTEYDTLDIFLYKKMPEICILDSEFIIAANSGKIAYEALALMCMGVESAVKSNNRYVSQIALTAVREIYNNILPSYRGEISARENLCSAMYAAFTAFINSFEYSWQSDCYRIASFFTSWGIPMLTSVAAAFSELSEDLFCENEHRFASFAKDLGLYGQEELAPLNFIGDVRKLQAMLCVPSAQRSFGISEGEFRNMCKDMPDKDRELICRCYYGSLGFVKRDGAYVSKMRADIL